MSYGIEIYDNNGANMLRSDFFNFFLFKTVTINIPAGTSNLAPYFHQTDIPVDCPIQVFYKASVNAGDDQVGIETTLPFFAPLPWKWGIQAKGPSDRALSRAITLTCYIFIPTYKAKLKDNTYGLELYDETGKTLFTLARPLLIVQDIFTQTQSFTGSNITSTPSRTCSYKPAIMHTEVGNYAPTNLRNYTYFFIAVNNTMSLGRFRQDYSSPFDQVELVRNPTATVQTIDSEAYDGFPNLTWQQVTVDGI